MNISCRAAVTSDEINALARLCWDDHEGCDYNNILKHSLAWVTARADDETLIGFYNLAWDGGRHALVFDLNVHPDFRRQGIALKMLEHAPRIAKESGVKYLHVDCDVSLEDLYKKAGYEMISAGIVYL